MAVQSPTYITTISIRWSIPHLRFRRAKIAASTPGARRLRPQKNAVAPSLQPPRAGVRRSWQVALALGAAQQALRRLVGVETALDDVGQQPVELRAPPTHV